MTTLTKPLPMPSAPSPSRELELELELELEVDERGARQSLRTQIARLELHLARALAAEDSAGPVEVPRSTTGSARLLTLGELERTRDALAGALHTARRRQEEQEDAHAQTRRLLEEARQDPRGHKYLRIALVDLGLPGCGHYRVRPRFGLLGMLMGWWELKLSGGCPLPGQPSSRVSPPAPSRDASARRPRPSARRFRPA